MPGSVMVALRLRVVPPEYAVGRTVVLGQIPPLIRGSGGDILACGTTLLSEVDADRIARWVFRCPECGAHNAD